MLHRSDKKVVTDGSPASEPRPGCTGGGGGGLAPCCVASTLCNSTAPLCMEGARLGLFRWPPPLRARARLPGWVRGSRGPVRKAGISGVEQRSGDISGAWVFMRWL